ncbi:MAG: tetratricopeptide repeat protein [Bacteroidota bacterium]
MKMEIRTIFITLFIATSLNLAAQENIENAFEKSYALEKQGNYNGAINLIKTVYSANSYELNLRLGYLNYEAGFHAESMNYYARAIVLLPNAIEPKIGYVYPASILGKWDEVLKQYLDILKIDPQNSSVNYKTGLIYYNRKNYVQAYKHFEKVVSLYPFDYDGLIMFAWTNYQIGKPKEAKALFKRVMLLSPNDKSALEGLTLIK